jgi:hypothetical protein
MTPRRALAVGIAALLLILLLGALAIGGVAANRGAGAIRLDSPPVGGHIYSLWLLPCDAFTPGLVMVGRDLYIFSSYPPPGPKLFLAPACP